MHNDENDENEEEPIPLNLRDVVEIAKVYHCPLQTLTLLKYIRMAGESCEADLQDLLPSDGLVYGPPGEKGSVGTPVATKFYSLKIQVIIFRD